MVIHEQMALRFASIPVKFAPKRKMVGFALPVWKNKLGEFEDADLRSWVLDRYQTKVFPTREEFNRAYDGGYHLWEGQAMVLNKEDLADLQEQFDEGAFDDGPKDKIAKMLTKAHAHMECDKVIFVY